MTKATKKHGHKDVKGKHSDGRRDGPVTDAHELEPSADRLRRAGWVRAAGWVGFVGGYAVAQAVAMHLSGDAAKKTRQLDTPPFNPPTVVFPVVWTALNVLTGTSAWLVWDRGTPGDPARRNALVAWSAAVVARTGYSPLEFGLEKRWLATADAGLLAATMGTYAVLAGRVDRLAGALALPEAAWTSFATVLSADIARRNA